MDFGNAAWMEHISNKVIFDPETKFGFEITEQQKKYGRLNWRWQIAC